ncbi:hypothetical protein NPIL_173211 [Nephila pilipes]|uniref:Uncharacterized protein n=1 Tax=Nephila pilipes TaxID=299642 RepID=A0A8X6QI98_NEPPI|nr:hypothetical protein NPIL_173211 [Nephila pilipes]
MGPDHESDVPLVQTNVHRVNKMNPKNTERMVDLPVPLSPLPPTPVYSPRSMSPAESVAELPELNFETSVAVSPELFFAKYLQPCSTEPRTAASRPGPSMAKPTVVSVVQRGTDPPRRKRYRSKEEKKSPKRSHTDEGKSSGRHTFPDARPHDPRSQDARPLYFKIPPRHIPLLGDVSFLRLGKNPVPKFFFHHHGLAVFSSLDDVFMLTNGVVSYALDQRCPNTLSKCLTYINIGTVCVTDARSEVQFRAFQNSLPTLSPWKRLTIVTLNYGKEDIDPCSYCNRKECHR